MEIYGNTEYETPHFLFFSIYTHFCGQWLEHDANISYATKMKLIIRVFTCKAASTITNSAQLDKTDNNAQWDAHYEIHFTNETCFIGFSISTKRLSKIAPMTANINF